MAKVKFTAALKRFFPELSDGEFEGKTVHDIVMNADSLFPGIRNYLLEEDGSLRKHVNIFLKEELIRDRHQLKDQVDDHDEVLIYQALSGG